MSEAYTVLDRFPDYHGDDVEVGRRFDGAVCVSISTARQQPEDGEDVTAALVGEQLTRFREALDRAAMPGQPGEARE